MDTVDKLTLGDKFAILRAAFRMQRIMWLFAPAYLAVGIGVAYSYHTLNFLYGAICGFCLYRIGKYIKECIQLTRRDYILIKYAYKKALHLGMIVDKVKEKDTREH